MPTLPSVAATASIVLPLPYGTVISYLGNSSNLAGLVSLGWLQCDGSSVSATSYPSLYAAIGTTYGGNGSPNFNLPNLAGMFLRGIDPAGQVDPDSHTRTSPIPGNATQVGATIGSRQGGQVQNHFHNWSSNFGQITKSGSALNVQLAQNSPTGNDQPAPQQTTDNDGGGAETRPINTYVYYLIFAGPPQME